MQPFPGRGIFLLVRHGETEWNRERRVMGRRPVPLNETGRAQIERLTPTLARLGARALWSSPLSRARETAEVIGAGLGLPVETEEGLTEVDYGAWESCGFAELIADPAYHAYHRDPEHAPIPGGGETLAGVRDRVCGALARIAASSPEGCAIVVSHGDPIRLVLAACLRLSVAEMRRLRVDNGAVSGIELTGDWAEVKFVNARSDLEGILRPAEDGARAVLSRSETR